MPKLGIDKLQKVIIEGVDVFRVAQDKLSDGFQWTDAISIGMEAKDLSFVVTNWAEVKAQFNDIDPDEIEALIMALVKELGVTNEKALNLIHKSLNFLTAGYELGVAIKDLKE